MSDAPPATAGAPAATRIALTFTLALALDAALFAAALGGPHALLRHPRALALLAVWAPAQLALAIRRPVRTRDPLTTERESPLVLIVLLVIPLLAPAVAAWSERAGHAPLPGGEPLRWAGVALSGFGYALRVAAMMRLGSRFSPHVELQREHGLETGGPYAWVRHPGYLGAWLVVVGAALAFGSGVGLGLAALMWVALEVRMRREERLLEARFGAAFEAWRGKTGRFLPRPGRS